MRVAIIDYGSGNLRSAAKAFERQAAELGGDIVVQVTADADDVRSADRIVLPGVGAFADCSKGLHNVDGMVDALTEAVLKSGRPFLGVCVGMQLMASVGREHRDHPGLDWIPGEVVRIETDDPALKIPHMGWNDLLIDAPDHPLFEGLRSGEHAYFVHSYQYRCAEAGHALAHVNYGGAVTAAIGRDNLFGTQFHPEKSQAFGLRLISNFLEWRP
jgi:glutamine amidotransferase